MHSENLFNNYPKVENNAPLADQLRPKNLKDFFGQQSILNENSLLRNAIINDKISNFIFSGPPGVGKTTLIEIISIRVVFPTPGGPEKIKLLMLSFNIALLKREFSFKIDC